MTACLSDTLGVHTLTKKSSVLDNWLGQEPRLRIAFVTFSYNSGGLGIMTYSCNLVKWLKKLGAEVDVFSFPIHPPVIGPPLFILSGILKKLDNYDVIHSHECAGLLVRHDKVVEVYHHDSRLSNRFWDSCFNAVERQAMRKSSLIVTPSFFTKKCLMQQGFSDEKITVVHQGVDHSIFKPNKEIRFRLRKKYGLNGFIAITVGAMTKRKNQEDLIKSLSDLKDVTLVLVGKGPKKAEVLNLAKELSVNILHFEFVPTNVLVELYNAADVYLHSAMLEGFGLPILEAMSCGLPVVAYDTADFRYIVGDGGIIVKQGDLEGLKEGIEVMASNMKQRNQFAHNAYLNSLRFYWEKTAKTYLKIYRAALTRHA